MILSYLSGKKDTIISGLGGSAVATHAEKHGITKAEAYQVRSTKAKVTTLKKEFPPIAGFDNNQELHMSKQLILSNGQRTNVTVNINDLLGAGDISIKVGDSYNKDDSIPPKDRLKIALKAKSMVKEAVKTMPDGTLLINSPYDGDGLGKERKKLYMAAGFSPGGDDAPMIGIVKNGRIKPITPEQITILQEAGYSK